MAKCDSYDFGQCTWYVCSELSWVPEGLGNAADWLANGIAAGLQSANFAIRGSVVVFGAGNGYSDFGHVAIVDAVHADGSFLVREMNYSAWDTVDYRNTTYFDALGFLLPSDGLPGESDAPPPTSGAPGTPALTDAWAMLQNSFNFVLPTNFGWLSTLADQLRDLSGL